MFISAGSSTRSIRAHGDLLIVGGEGHETGSGQAMTERFERLEDYARTHWDVAAITHRWSAQDSAHYGHLPVIRPYRPGSTRLWVTSGFMKWGFASAMFAAMILADLIGERPNPWAATFTPTRLAARALHGPGVRAAKFTAHMVGDRMRPPSARSAEEIAPRQALALADGLGNKGAYRDDEGQLHQVSLRCTHQGCLLRFNAAETSWDCPCHGSRFDVDGAVLERPATHPLRRR